MKKLVLSLLFVLLPVVTFAAGEDVKKIVENIGSIVDTLIPIAFSIGLLGFFWGLARYIFNANDDEKKSEGKNIMIWGAIALFVMSSIWGIVGFIAQTFGVEENQRTISAPTVKK